MHVICVQYRDGVKDEAPPIVIPALDDESPLATLRRKLAGAEYHEWSVEQTGNGSFHAWKEYSDGDGTPDRPHRKDRWFVIV